MEEKLKPDAVMQLYKIIKSAGLHDTPHYFTYHPQRQIEYTTSATAIAIPTVVNASGQVIDSPPAAVLVVASSVMVSTTHQVLPTHH